MNPVSNSSTVISTLDRGFHKIDRNHDGNLDKKEFGPFYEMLKGGIAKEVDGSYQRSEQQEFERLDKNQDGLVSEEEMKGSSFLMRADLCSDTLNPMIEYLFQQKTASAAAAAALLSDPSDENTKPDSVKR